MLPVQDTADRGFENIVECRGQAAHLRAQMYRLLALCFYQPNEALAGDFGDGSLATALHSLLKKLEVPGGEDSVATLVGQPYGLDADGMYLSLKREYTRLFVGPGHLPAPPYESVHRRDVPELERGLVMGRATVDAQKQYAASGLKLSPTYTDLPDHIGVELEFMYYLCAKEAEAWWASDAEAARRRQQAQHLFLSQHLAQWVPAFCRAVNVVAQMDFYKGLAQLTQAFIEAECFQVCSANRPLNRGWSRRSSQAHAMGGQE